MASSSLSLNPLTEILSPAVLAQSPHLPAVVKLLNYTYDHSHLKGRNGRLLPPDPTTRLQSLTQLSSELEPGGFTILMFSSDIPQEEDIEGLTANGANGATLIATVSAKPYAPTKSEGEAVGVKTHLLFKRPPPDADESKMSDEKGQSDGDERSWPKWEILATAVHPSLQGRGLASTLLEQVTAEVKSRTSTSVAARPPPPRDQSSVRSTGNLETENTHEEVQGKGKVLLMLSTMLELNEPYFLNRGFRTTAVRRFGPGTMASRDGFSVVEMMRWVDL